MAKVLGSIKLTQIKVRDQLFAGLYAAAEMIRADAAHSITAGSVSGKKHVPSLPGQPPNRDTGQLDTGIVVMPDKARMAVRVVSMAPHSVPLEYGTVKMAARPFLRPALARNKTAALNFVKAAVQRAIKGSTP